MGFRKELSKRLSTSFRLSKSPGDRHETRALDRENSESSALSVHSQQSESSTSLSSVHNRQPSLLKKGNPNWFFTEEFSFSFSENSVTPTKASSGNGLAVQPMSSDDLLILPLWVISSKGLMYQGLRSQDEARLRKLPEACQNILLELHKKVTIYDYENSERIVTVMHGLLDPTEIKTIPARRRDKPKLEKPQSSKKVDKRAAFQQKRGVSTIFSTQIRNRSFERSASRRAPIWWLDIENNKLDDHGIEATLVKAEIQLVGGSTVLSYYVEVDCGQHDLSFNNNNNSSCNNLALAETVCESSAVIIQG